MIADVAGFIACDGATDHVPLPDSLVRGTTPAPRSGGEESRRHGVHGPETDSQPLRGRLEEAAHAAQLRESGGGSWCSRRGASAVEEIGRLSRARPRPHP
ncbi:hypothetical protein [Streptomyces sp. NPDC001930]|uniref:hypothetical protein n=1 Tax=Streptomyces sp. NPDC001930 TaxID=3364625 RepID=UPI003676C0DA